MRMRAAGLLRSIVARARRALRPAREPSPQPPPLPPLVGYVVHGVDGVHPATAHIRVTRRINRSVLSGRIRARRLDPRRLLSGADDARYDIVLVQRDAVDAALEPAFVAAVRAAGAGLVVDIDDDFFTESARRRLRATEFAPDRLEAVADLVRAADAVLVSSPRLAAIVQQRTSALVAFVPNELDPEFWVDDPVTMLPTPDDDVVRVLYAGSTTHGDDLALLRDVFAELATDDGRPVHLELVGVTPASGPDAWWDRLAIPDGWTHYPEFTRWMRGNADRWSAAVAPLADDEFNRSKSDLKILDYGLLGLPVVASDAEAYRHMRGEGVQLVPNTTPSWRAAILAAITDPRAGDALRSRVLAGRMIGADATWERVLLNTRRRHR
ncbi:glycosyltransferase [Curtobacterium ammoniigenes]|uniref:glycosyltransferase n=1 Tax=Curtobacterium ammoniigenes TaxID=395387 RepID=UPI00082C2BE9|nr:glycosyltransferase [Curtobacterium ammoniigenes]